MTLMNEVIKELDYSRLFLSVDLLYEPKDVNFLFHTTLIELCSPKHHFNCQWAVSMLNIESLDHDSERSLSELLNNLVATSIHQISRFDNKRPLSEECHTLLNSWVCGDING